MTLIRLNHIILVYCLPECIVFGGEMRLLFLTFTTIVLLSCSGDGDRSTTPSQAVDSSTTPSLPGFPTNSFFANPGVQPSFTTFSGTENVYVVKFNGFVTNSSNISLLNVRVMVQIFNSDLEQIGVKLADCRPTTISPKGFSSYLVEFSPIHNPFYVTSLRITPYSDRGMGFALSQNIIWPPPPPSF